MSFRPLRYEPYQAAAMVPNVVVDGSPNDSTTLTLSHWPGTPTPADRTDLADDLSAQMAYHYLGCDRPLHGPAEVVTNNHFDQDGLISVFALSRPNDALARRALLTDVAAAGDFATYRDRRAARLSMVIAAYADPARSPLGPLPDDYDEQCAVLYAELLDRLPDIADRIEDHRHLWEDEDRQLAESESALGRGDVVIEEHPGLDLAVVTIDEKVSGWSGHRFAGRHFDGIHPMALHNATDRFSLLVVHGRRYRFIHRYETWVQYRSRRIRPRVELAGLAERLTAIETGSARWRADPVGDLTPQLELEGESESTIAPAQVVSLVLRHLADAAPAWDPYTPRTSSSSETA